MPGGLTEGLGVPADRPRIARPVEFIIVGVGVLMLVALAVNFSQNRDIKSNLDDQRQTQLDGVQRGYINRAVTCDLQKGLGLHESENCADPAIAKYRDAQTGASSSTGASESKRTRELVCLVLQQASKAPGSSVAIPPSMCPAS